MRRKLAVTLLTINLILLSQVGWSCDTPVTPKSQCQSGATKASHSGGKTKYFECHNNEWIPVDCLNRSTKTSGGHHYTCRSNQWKRDN